MQSYITTADEALDEVKVLERLGATRVIVPAAMFKQDPVEALRRYGVDVIGRA